MKTSTKQHKQPVRQYLRRLRDNEVIRATDLQYSVPDKPEWARQLNLTSEGLDGRTRNDIKPLFTKLGTEPNFYYRLTTRRAVKPKSRYRVVTNKRGHAFVVDGWMGWACSFGGLAQEVCDSLNAGTSRVQFENYAGDSINREGLL